MAGHRSLAHHCGDHERSALRERDAVPHRDAAPISGHGYANSGVT
jgi:hypothetical protein